VIWKDAIEEKLVPEDLPIEVKPIVDQATQPHFEAGVFLIDKPAGPTSFAMVHRLRRVLGIKKVGHAGTLDPFASGLLILCAGRSATKHISSFMQGEKEYLATLCLGVETDTFDPEGRVTQRLPVGRISAAEIEKCLNEFRGEQLQAPPVYSALKHKGRPLYYYARKGIEIVKEARHITIRTLERTDGDGDLQGDEALLCVRVVCSKGTYIRSLAADIGRRLGCGAYLKELRRTRSGCFSIEQCLPGDVFSAEDVREQVMNSAMSLEQACKLLQ